MAGALKEAGGDPDVRVVILTGAREKAFIGGADVKEMLARVKAGLFGLGQARSHE